MTNAFHKNISSVEMNGAHITLKCTSKTDEEITHKVICCLLHYTFCESPKNHEMVVNTSRNWDRESENLAVMSY